MSKVKDYAVRLAWATGGKVKVSTWRGAVPLIALASSAAPEWLPSPLPGWRQK